MHGIAIKQLKASDRLYTLSLLAKINFRVDLYGTDSYEVSWLHEWHVAMFSSSFI